tara:strand:- start:366 stop:1082 length:717 start_codon:yes stop_codon:yes gene_type:complete
MEQKKREEIRVLVGCESSRTVADAFEWEAGFDAWSCDLLPSDQPSNKHIVGDIRDVVKDFQPDLLYIAHPPCTRLCNSGVRWLENPPAGKTVADMRRELVEGCSLFREMLDSDVPFVAVENPIMHKHAKRLIWGEDYQKLAKNDGLYTRTTVNPFEFAASIDSEDNQKKATHLWIKGLPALQKTSNLTRETARDDIHKAPPSADRWKFRSKFHKGMASAMARQWGDFVFSQYNSQFAA